MKCPECNEEIPAGTRICPNCDYELTDAEFAAAGGAAAPDKPTVSAPERPNMAAPSKPSAAAPSKPNISAPTKPGKPAAPDVAMPESIMAHGDVSVSADHSVHNTQNNTQNTQNNIANTTNVANNTTNNTQQTIIINVGAGGQLPGGIVDDATTAAVNDAASKQKQPRQQHQQQSAPHVEAEEGQKGVGSITGEGTIYIKTGRRMPTWLIATIAGVVLGIGIVIYLRTSRKPVTEGAKTETVAAPAQNATPAGQTAAKTGTASKPASKPKPADPYADGMKAYNNGDYDNAVKNLTKASNLSDKQKAGEAAFKLGTMYENGEGVDANKQKAIEWYEKAAKLGNKNAKRKLM